MRVIRRRLLNNGSTMMDSAIKVISPPSMNFGTDDRIDAPNIMTAAVMAAQVSAGIGFGTPSL